MTLEEKLFWYAGAVGILECCSVTLPVCLSGTDTCVVRIVTLKIPALASVGKLKEESVK
jgi:hypothetical protein